MTHYVRHDAWIEDGGLLRHAARLADVPGAIINGRLDFQSPLGSAWALHRVWPVDLVVVDDAGHDAGAPGITAALVAATNRFALF